MQKLVANDTSSRRQLITYSGIIDVTGVAGIPDEEYFGPLTTIQRYDSFDEALKLPMQLVSACQLD